MNANLIIIRELTETCKRNKIHSVSQTVIQVQPDMNIGVRKIIQTYLTPGKIQGFTWKFAPTERISRPNLETET